MQPPITIKAPALHANARIGIVSPAYWMQTDRMNRALEVLKGMGYSIELGACARAKDNRFAGTAEQRAAEIMAMFSNSDIDAILCARGGYGTNRVNHLLNYELIGKNPKIFIGYSDITGLLTSITQKTGLITFHGPMLTTFADYPEKYNLDTFRQLLSGQHNIKLRAPTDSKARILKTGSAGGPCWGGNLSLLIARLGTDNQLDTAGCILFLEDIDEELYAFERMLLQLKESASLGNINGLIIGEMKDMHDGDIPFGKSTDEIVLDICADLDIPIISNFPCGHGRYQASLPISHTVELHARNDNPFILIPDSPLAT